MTFNVLYCSDNNYAPYLGVSLYSLLDHNKCADAINVYVVSDNISDDNITKMKNQVSKYGDTRRLIIIDGSQWVDKLISLNILPYRGGQTTNLRLFFMEYIEKNVERLLYLDCDTIIRGNIGELFEAPMGNTSAAVALDSLSGKEYKSIIGFREEDRYFNAGVVLFNVTNWVQNDCQHRLSALMNDPRYNLPNNDQDFLNLLLKEEKTVVSAKYNFQTTHQVYSNKTFYACYPEKGYYTETELTEAQGNPLILHAYRFLGQFPWHKKNLHPWNDIFWEYARASEWSELTPRENSGVFFTLERIVFRIIPKRWFLSLFKAAQTRAFKKRFNMMQRKSKEGGATK